MWGFTLHPHPKVSLLASGSEELQSLKRKLVETLIGHSFFFLLVEKASESQVAVKRPASLVQKAFHRLPSQGAVLCQGRAGSMTLDIGFGGERSVHF